MSFLAKASDLQIRLLMVIISVTYLVTGWITHSYPPTYLANSEVWAAVFFTAGWGPMWTFVLHRKDVAALTGGLLVGSALFRAAAIFVELGWQRFLRALTGDTEQAISASFAIAGFSWVLIGGLLWLLWPAMMARFLGDSNER